MPRKRKTKNKPTSLNLPIIILSTIVVVLALLGIYLTSTNIVLQEQTENFKKEIIKLKEQQSKFLKEQEDQVAKYFEEKTKDLEIEYAKPIDNLSYIQTNKDDNKAKFIYDDEEYTPSGEIAKEGKQVIEKKAEPDVKIKKSTH